MPIIEANQLSKTYRVADKEPGVRGTLKHFVNRKWNDVKAVREVSFAIEAGEIVGFLGPNGAGKTTALKMLTGLIHPTSGVATVCGATPFERRAEFLRRITLVMGQKQQLIWDLPPLDSLRINAAVYEIEEAEAEKRIAELADMLELSTQLKKPVRKLSLGERMNAELMAALLHRPEVLFLDEPTLGLDVNAQARVRDFLRDYNQRYSATVLLTSHYMADITALCERVLLIHEGALFYDGSLEGIVNRFVPYREVRIQLEQTVSAEELAKFGEVEMLEGLDARLLVARERLTAVVSELLAKHAVRDLTVGDPPIEEVIGRIFVEGKAS